jgi:hypothetical protein
MTWDGVDHPVGPQKPPQQTHPKASSQANLATLPAIRMHLPECVRPESMAAMIETTKQQVTEPKC